MRKPQARPRCRSFIEPETSISSSTRRWRCLRVRRRQADDLAVAPHHVAERTARISVAAFARRQAGATRRRGNACGQRAGERAQRPRPRHRRKRRANSRSATGRVARPTVLRPPAQQAARCRHRGRRRRSAHRLVGLAQRRRGQDATEEDSVEQRVELLAPLGRRPERGVRRATHVHDGARTEQPDRGDERSASAPARPRSPLARSSCAKTPETERAGAAGVMRRLHAAGHRAAAPRRRGRPDPSAPRRWRARRPRGHGAPCSLRSVAASAHSTVSATPGGLASGSARSAPTAATTRCAVSRATDARRASSRSAASSAGSG